MLRMAQIALPLLDNEGRSLEEAHHKLATILCEQFGGYTAIQSRGGWIDPVSGNLYCEDGTVYMVAMEDNGENRATLRTIACVTGFDTGQKAMFVVYPSGDTEIIPEDEYSHDEGAAECMRAVRYKARQLANAPWPEAKAVIDKMAADLTAKAMQAYDNA